MRDREPMTLSICIDCVMHLANGECGTCHNDPFEYRFGKRDDDYQCVTGTRIDRAMTRRFAGVHITLGCTEEDCCDGGDSEPWYSSSACGLCGDTDHGDREHATAWIVPDRKVTRTMRSGAVVIYRPDTFEWRQLMVGYNNGWSWLGAYDGSDRYLRLAEHKRKYMGTDERTI
jgi:hypothetical protein